ncbi:MAG: DUF1361 domain-containing protein [Verrucomicrobiota bacterium]
MNTKIEWPPSPNVRRVLDELIALPWQPVLVTLLVLCGASAVGVVLLLARMKVSGSPNFRFLPWNLLLAWLPLFFAVGAWFCHRLGRGRTWAFAGCAVAWLLFFPNAPYIVTDLVHLRPRAPVPMWYDIILILTFAFTGLLLGFFSLRLMQHLVAHRWGWVAGWAFAGLAAGLAGFGVFLGRFLRWNSWDALLQPWALLGDIAQRLANPWPHKHGFLFAALFAVFLFSAYTLLCVVTYWNPRAPLPAFRADPGSPPPAA